MHNLRDMRFGLAGATMPYTKPFDEALREAVETADVKERESRMVALLKNKNARGARKSPFLRFGMS